MAFQIALFPEVRIFVIEMRCSMRVQAQSRMDRIPPSFLTSVTLRLQLYRSADSPHPKNKPRRVPEGPTEESPK